LALLHDGRRARVARSFLGLCGMVLGAGCFADPTPASPDEGTGDVSSTSSDGLGTTHAATDETTAASTDDGGQQTTTSADTRADTTIATDTSTGTSGDAESDAESSDDGTSTGLVDACGNDAIDLDEACDGDMLGDGTCGSLGYLPGRLACNVDCTFDTSGCAPPPADMVFVEGGQFEMGTTNFAEEQPVRDVLVDPFFIHTTEVTTEAFTECVMDGSCDTPTPSVGAAFIEECNYLDPERQQHPINCVTLDLAIQYCEWLGMRLPTEAEWEKAAHGPEVTTFPWGDAPAPSCANTIMGDGGSGCGVGSTWPVGSREDGESFYGGLDMAGNVWEWVSDWYGTYDLGALDNPVGPATGAFRILRGGGWYHMAAADFTTTHRHEVDPMLADPFIGFRCVLPADP